MGAEHRARPCAQCRCCAVREQWSGAPGALLGGIGCVVAASAGRPVGTGSIGVRRRHSSSALSSAYSAFSRSRLCSARSVALPTAVPAGAAPPAARLAGGGSAVTPAGRLRAADPVDLARSRSRSLAPALSLVFSPLARGAADRSAPAPGRYPAAGLGLRLRVAAFLAAPPDGRGGMPALRGVLLARGAGAAVLSDGPALRGGRAAAGVAALRGAFFAVRTCVSISSIMWPSHSSCPLLALSAACSSCSGGLGMPWGAASQTNIRCTHHRAARGIKHRFPDASGMLT
mmetsp:Transcript_27306/g.68756  ORF Transcript_27306/g.68756 Transcript_27306/m.68756 type:complete len:287 (+) Transcript_27306:432-1292(+)